MDKIIFEYTDLNEEYALESAWAEKKGEFYELRNILFYAYGYSFGDLVSVENRNGELYVIGLVEESGHSTIRIIFYNDETVYTTSEHLQSMGCSFEGSNIPTLVSVDIPPNVNYSPIRKFLIEGEISDLWGFEEACLAHELD